MCGAHVSRVEFWILLLTRRMGHHGTSYFCSCIHMASHIQVQLSLSFQDVTWHGLWKYVAPHAEPKRFCSGLNSWRILCHKRRTQPRFFQDMTVWSTLLLNNSEFTTRLSSPMANSQYLSLYFCTIFRYTLSSGCRRRKSMRPNVLGGFLPMQLLLDIQEPGQTLLAEQRWITGLSLPGFTCYKARNSQEYIWAENLVIPFCPLVT